MILRVAGVLAAAVGIALGAAPEDAAAAQPEPFCDPAPANCGGWHRASFFVHWTWDPVGVEATACKSTHVTADTTGLLLTCTVKYVGTLDPPGVITVKRDATRPQVTAVNPGREPDAGGWYNRPVAINLSGTDATSGIASCTTPQLSGPDGGARVVTGTCTDVAGNVSAPGSVTLKYDATPPSVEVVPDRPPDAGNSYRSPVTITFKGSDETSGVESCTPPVRYEGPDQAVKLVGSCRDAAGNATEVAHEFQYDSTAPKLSNVRATAGKGAVRIQWQRPADAASIRIVRQPGRGGEKSTELYNGAVGVSYADKSIRAGVSYRYEVSAFDQAGNMTRVTVSATKRKAPLFRPAKGAVVRGPVRLAWEAGKASFFNVQVFRRGVKVLSAWPGSASLRLRPSWRYDGKSYRLVPGLYRWYVWRGGGTRAKPKYGPPLGTSTFVVKRR